MAGQRHSVTCTIILSLFFGTLYFSNALISFALLFIPAILPPLSPCNFTILYIHGFLKRISSLRTCHRYLHLPHHRFFPPCRSKSGILLGNQMLVALPSVGNRRRHCLNLYQKHSNSLASRRICILIILDHQRNIRTRRTGKKRLVPQESQTDL